MSGAIRERPQFTDHCFTGDYPTPLTDRTGATTRRGNCRCWPRRADAQPCMQPLAGRIALVTGASRGIGHATAIALAKAGAHVVAIARTVGGLEELDDAIKAAGGSATLVPLDLKDYDGIDRLGASLHERYGKLDVLVAMPASSARSRRSAMSSRKCWTT